MTRVVVTATDAAPPPPPPLGVVVVVVEVVVVVLGSEQWPYSQSQFLLHSSSSQMQMSTCGYQGKMYVY